MTACKLSNKWSVVSDSKRLKKKNLSHIFIYPTGIHCSNKLGFFHSYYENPESAKSKTANYMFRKKMLYHGNCHILDQAQQRDVSFVHLFTFKKCYPYLLWTESSQVNISGSNYHMLWFKKHISMYFYVFMCTSHCRVLNILFHWIPYSSGCYSATSIYAPYHHKGINFNFNKCKCQWIMKAEIYQYEMLWGWFILRQRKRYTQEIPFSFLL